MQSNVFVWRSGLVVTDAGICFRERFCYLLSLRIQLILICQAAYTFTDHCDRAFMLFSMVWIEMVRKLLLFAVLGKGIIT